MATGRNGHRRPTITDVAEAAGVSIKTVSRVVHNVTTVNEAIAERVRETIAQLGYRPNQLASTLKSGSATSTVGLILKDISNEFYAAIALGVSSVAHARDTQLITAASDEDIDNDKEIDLIFELCKRRVDGLIIVPRGGDYSRLQPEVDMGLPMVFLDREGAGLDADAIVLDNAGGTKAVIDTLLGMGHRRIGLVFHSLELPQIRQRHDAAIAALTAAGAPPAPEVVVTDVTSPQAAFEATRRLLSSDDPPTAVFCANNRLTEGAVRAVWHTRAATVVSGFDDFRFSDMMPVPLVLASYDAKEYGRIAARLLFRRIDGDDSPRASIVVPTEVIRRGLAAD